MQGDTKNPKLPIQRNNRKPVRPLNNRTVRTNINFKQPVSIQSY